MNTTTICPACGRENLAGADQCEHCGGDLRALDSSPRVETEFGAHILATRIGDIELARPILVGPDDTLGEVIECLNAAHQGCVLVVEDGLLVGIFGERDIVRDHVGRAGAWRRDRVGDHMIRAPRVLGPDATLAHALAMMDIGDYRHVPVVDAEGRPSGVLSIKRILRHLHEWMEE